MDNREGTVTMKKIVPRYVYDEHEKKIGVVLKVKDFEALIDELEDYQDYLLATKRGGKRHKKTYTSAEMMRNLGIKK